MNRAGLLIVAVLALAVLAFFCIRGHAPGIEAEIGQRSNEALAAAGIDWATATADGQNLTLEGITASEDDKTRVRQVVGAVWGVASVANGIRVVASPLEAAKLTSGYWMALDYDGSSARLSGVTPDEPVRTAIRELLANVFGAEHVAGDLEIAAGAPAGWEAAAAAALGALGGADRATATIIDTTVTVAGEVSSAAQRDELAAAIRGALPAGYAAEIDLSVAVAAAETTATTSAACVRQIEGLVNDRHILFDNGSRRLRTESRRFLAELAEQAAGCPSVRLQINDYTDSSGPSQLNMTLSERRVAVVSEALTAAGLAFDRVATVAYGEEQPTASNGSTPGRRANRRVEIAVRR